MFESLEFYIDKPKALLKYVAEGRPSETLLISRASQSEISFANTESPVARESVDQYHFENQDRSRKYLLAKIKSLKRVRNV